jgi:sec-independent protein translocase protein TatC
MAVRTDRDPEEEKQEQGEEELQGQMSFFDHLEELRQRIFKILIAVAIGFSACWWFRDPIWNFVRRPIDKAGVHLITVNISEGFITQFKLSVTAAIFLTAPFIIAQIWLFIAPGLYKRERRYAMPFIICSSLLFLLGGIFGYYLAFPYAIQFLAEFTRQMKVDVLPTLESYLSLFIGVELALGAVFQIPAIIFILSRLGLVSARFLLMNTKYAILVSAIIAAVLTPTPDAFNMMVMLVPMLGLYMLGVLVAFFFGKKRKKEED